jgi:hypothetical protein
MINDNLTIRSFSYALLIKGLGAGLHTLLPGLYLVPCYIFSPFVKTRFLFIFIKKNVKSINFFLLTNTYKPDV